MITPRLRRLEKAVDELAGAACRMCNDGFCAPFIVVRWRREDGTHREEADKSDIFNTAGNCRACGRNWGQTTLQLLEDQPQEAAA